MYVCMYFNHLKKKICRFQYVCIIVVVVVVVVVFASNIDDPVNDDHVRSMLKPLNIKLNLI